MISAKYKYSVDERWIRGNKAEIACGYVALGQIDETLRYTSPDARFYGNKTAVIYHLKLGEKHAELGADGVTEKEVVGPTAWRIDDQAPVFWLTLDTAVRYVKEAKQRSHDATVKQNADQTLASLKSMQ